MYFPLNLIYFIWTVKASISRSMVQWLFLCVSCPNNQTKEKSVSICFIDAIANLYIFYLYFAYLQFDEHSDFGVWVYIVARLYILCIIEYIWTKRQKYHSIHIVYGFVCESYVCVCVWVHMDVCMCSYSHKLFVWLMLYVRWHSSLLTNVCLYVCMSAGVCVC